MKHRRVVGGPKKKNRIQEVNATVIEDVNTSPLESPRLGNDDDEGGGVNAVQRFLTNRRNRRAHEESGGFNNTNLRTRPSMSSSTSGSANASRHDNGTFPVVNDDDEPDNDSGDEGLTRRRNILLGREPLPAPAPAMPPTTVKTSDTLTPSIQATPAAVAPSFPPISSTAPTPIRVNNNVDTTTSMAANNNNNNNNMNRNLDVIHPLLQRTASSTGGESSTTPQSSPHHRPRAPSVTPSVTFSMQTTDLESGQPFLALSAAPVSQQQEEATNTETTKQDTFLGFLLGQNNNSNNQPSTETTPSTSWMDYNNNTNTNPATINEETPLLTNPRDGSIRPGGIVDLTRATPLDVNTNDDDELGSFHSEADSTAGGDDKDGTTTNPNEDGQTAITGGQSLLEQFFEEGTQAVYDTVREATTEAWEQYDDSRHYDWREFYKGGGFVKFCRWIATGTAPENFKQSDDEIQENLNSLARMLSLLREYHERFGMPEVGGYKDQEYVLREVTKDLYLGGSPIWALEPVMKRVAEGLTGKRGVDFFMLPRRAFIFAPSSGATAMFRITRGYDMQRLDDMESVAVRLASFASNTSSVASVPSRWPKPMEMRRAFRTESLAGCFYTREEMAEEILNLASDAEGIFFYIRNHQTKCYANRESPLYTKDHTGKLSELGEFWTVEDDIRELFSRLAAIEAATAIDKIDVERKPLYSQPMVVMFRVLASACACAFWFNGSWVDILVSGILAELVAMIGSSPILSKQERIIFEAVASFVVGFAAASIAVTWPEYCCFGAMAISGVLDLLQGFRVVYSIIEIMSKHTVTGGADFLEGVFFTTLIAYCLRFGQYAALEILGTPADEEYMKCTKGISEWWYFLFVPVGAVAWSGLFNPHYFDLPIMAAHGVLGYLVSWQFYTAAATTQMNNFLAAAAVTFSAGIVSRFTGRQALGNTVAGLYVLLPGAYLVTTVYSDHIDGFLWQIILRAIIIGIGAWAGTLLCVPTLLGINKGLMEHNKGAPSLVENGSLSSNMSSSSSVASGQNFRRRDKAVRKNGTGALLFF